MKKILTFSLLFCFIFSAQSFADQKMKRLPKHTFGIGPEVYHIHYEEPQSAEAIMEDNGVMIGFKAMYTYHNNYNWMFRLESKFAWGTVDYTSMPTGGVNNIPAFNFEIRPLLGYDFYSDYQEIVYTLYSGFGYRYWNDRGSGKASVDLTGMYYGYDRESNYFYIPIGLEAQKDFSTGWALSGSAEYDWLIKGIQRSNLSAVPGFNDSITNNQGKGFGVRFGLKIMKKSKILDISLEPFLRYWHIDESNKSFAHFNGEAVGPFVEPNNRTTEIGADVMLYY